LRLLDRLTCNATARQILERLAADEETISVQLDGGVENVQVLGPSSETEALRTGCPRRRTAARVTLSWPASTRALDHLAKAEVLDLLYEPDHVTARLIAKSHEPPGATNQREVWPTAIRVEWTRPTSDDPERRKSIEYCVTTSSMDAPFGVDWCRLAGRETPEGSVLPCGPPV
jgi:hypothetical protein